MCGILGAFSLDLSALKLELKPSLQKLQHRGPDHLGSIMQGCCWLGHSRLSIIDTSESSNQPYQIGNYSIAYNGELYNYHDLRDELKKCGVSFNTSGDVEVVLQAWIKWGCKALSRFRGMFAFAVYNNSTQKLTIARDPFGIKPLFYKLIDRCLIFSSEIPALLDLEYNISGKKKESKVTSLSQRSLVDNVLHVWNAEENVLVGDVEKLLPGHFLEYSGSEVDLNCYYQPEIKNTENKRSPKTEADHIKQLDKVLKSSVDAHLVSDVPVHTFLSGGLDSSLLAAMAAPEVSNMEAYTIVFDEKYNKLEVMPDDLKYARIMAKKLGIKLNEINIKPDIIELLPQIVDSLGEPIGDAAAINTFLICDAAKRNGVKVLLSGMGADELFGGYRRHMAAHMAMTYRRIPNLLRKGLIEPFVRLLPVASEKYGFKYARWAKRFISFSGLSEEEAYHRSYTYFDKQGMTALLGRESIEHYDAIRSSHSQIYYSQDSSDHINRMCLTDIHRFMVSLNLTYSDRASMAASTEIRVPFIDREVVDCALSIPGKYKIKKGVSKYILKKVAENWLPKEVIYRPKMSFGMPLRAWIRNDLRDLVVDYVVSDQGLSARGIFDRSELKKIIDDNASGRQDNAQIIWNFLTLEQWFRNNRIDVKNTAELFST